ncbi:hypothetical protein JRO89_XS13G0173600 [Xanthoceras sorbifolium]|uniref:ABC transporter domain-containing protein n=1 Tax=Xanthoceras sorbifolium TaxID=99658 RepID=A0ABQ8H8V5_9ROSI|nr:hypothetical protein JRO89_XS13G0173600 [Xanthoceras sorbifolium]
MRDECVCDKHNQADIFVLVLKTQESVAKQLEKGILKFVNDVYHWLTATFFLWFMLAIYFDNIIPSALSVRKSIFYFLMPGYWTGKGGNKVEEGGCCCTGSVPALEHVTPDDEDVCEEENIVKEQTRGGRVESNVAVQIRGLVKTYPGMRKMDCCKCKKTSPFHAVKGSWMNVDKNRLFCLLGPNGAGKTTTIICLTGITPVTAGDASIYGYSIRSSAGLSNIRRIIGVGPQFDILWQELSGQEHLHLFASIKGLPPASIKSNAENSLAEVRLTGAAKVRAGSYSGGMKRRLSVAIALIGDPELTFWMNRLLHLNILPKEESKDFLTFVIPRDRAAFNNIQLGLTTLEEVFLNIVRQAELENSQAEGRLVTLTLTSGASVEEPQLRARFVGIPGSETAENPRGIMVEVYWETDDSGALRIAGHSPETLIPPSVRMSDYKISTSNSNSLGCNAQVRGIVIEPSQLSSANI